MNYVPFFVLALVLFCTAPADARTIKEMMDVTKNPIELKAKTSNLLSVDFNHASHRLVNCITCHHEVSGSKQRYMSCSKCHTQTGKSLEKMSLFRAFHAKDAKRSCYGCHVDHRTKDPKTYDILFANCRPCHSAASPTKKPILMQSNSSRLLDVTFNHSSHNNTSCFYCHHKNSQRNGRYVACRECHTSVGRSEKPTTLFAAAHSKNANRSCYACHSSLASQERYAKTFINCRPCHTNAAETK